MGPGNRDFFGPEIWPRAKRVPFSHVSIANFLRTHVGISTQLCDLYSPLSPLSPSTVCEGGGGGYGSQTDRHLSQSPFTGKFF